MGVKAAPPPVPGGGVPPAALTGAACVGYAPP